MAQEKCSCWRCWFQGSFTAIILFMLLVLSFTATLILMHEEIIADKYVIWLEGWDAGLLASLGVALKTGDSPTHTPDPPPAPAANIP